MTSYFYVSCSGEGGFIGALIVPAATEGIALQILEYEGRLPEGTVEALAVGPLEELHGMEVRRLYTYDELQEFGPLERIEPDDEEESDGQD